MLVLCNGGSDSRYIARSIATAVRKAVCVYSASIGQCVRIDVSDACLLKLTDDIF